MQKHIKTITDYLIKQQKNILKGAIILTGLIFVYALLFIQNSMIQDKTREDDSLNSISSTLGSDDLNFANLELDNINSEVIEDEMVIVPDVKEAIQVVSSPKISLPIVSSKALETVRSFFNSYNSENFDIACGLLSSSKCDPESATAVNRLASEYEKMEKGYENVNVWLAKDAEDFHSDVVCVKYAYKYKDDTKNKLVHEIMSFYVTEDEDGKEKITNRICEKKFAENIGEVPCPILSKRDFCLE